MPNTLIKNAQLVNEGEIQPRDILIKNQRIEKIASSIAASENDLVYDLHGHYLMPGVIDDQVHFREPGLTHKGSLSTESRAALAGGVTSFFDMPNCIPIIDSEARMRDKLEMAKGKCYGNYGFYMGATNENLDALKSMPLNLACGIKIFMGSSTGNMLVNKEEILSGIFEHAPIVVVTHCEDDPIIAANSDQMRKRYGEDIPLAMHPQIRSREACLASSTLATSLARKYDARLHVLHLTTADEMVLFDKGPVKNKKITAEVCVHHLYFSEADYPRLGAKIKCNPAIKALSDQKALIQAVNDDRIDIIATDHAPHLWSEKEGTYFNIVAGVPNVQHMLLSLLKMHDQGHMPLTTIVSKTAHQVADLFAIKDRGYVREGYYADLVSVNPSESYTVTDENTLYHCGWSPFTHEIFPFSIDKTWLAGQCVYENHQLLDLPPMGMPLEFDQQPR